MCSSEARGTTGCRSGPLDADRAVCGPGADRIGDTVPDGLETRLVGPDRIDLVASDCERSERDGLPPVDLRPHRSGGTWTFANPCGAGAPPWTGTLCSSSRARRKW